MVYAILMDHILQMALSMRILTLNAYHVFYLVKQVLVSGLELKVMILLTVTVVVRMILFAVLLQVMILLLSVFGLIIIIIIMT